MLKAMLVSPRFLSITPAQETGTEAEIVPLDDYQLASRLSYLLWATMPDDELLGLADMGQLHEPKNLRSQVKRMLQDPRSRALFDGFGAQWLGVGDLESKTFDSIKFPQMTNQLRAAMYDEARLFFESVVRENRGTASFIDSDYTFLNDSLASIYGLERTIAGRMRELTDEHRGGIFGDARSSRGDVVSQSHQSSYSRRVGTGTSAWGPVPSAPPDIPALEKQDQSSVAQLTLRRRHRTAPQRSRLCELPQVARPDWVWSREF